MRIPHDPRATETQSDAMAWMLGKDWLPYRLQRRFCTKLLREAGIRRSPRRRGHLAARCQSRRRRSRRGTPTRGEPDGDPDSAGDHDRVFARRGGAR